MKKFLVSAAVVVSVLAVSNVQASAVEQDLAPRAAAANTGKNELVEVGGKLVGAGQEIVKGGFLEDYMKEATKVEAIVDEIAGPNASMWSKFVARVTNPKKVIWPMVKFVGERALLPVVKAIV